jgi:quercetin dioxygenase-like cupin family protein
MRHLLAAMLVVTVSAPAQRAAAQSDDRAVPIVQAPFHVPVFTNEYVTFLSITVPPGRNTGYHIHSSDSVSVNIEPADMTNQNFGSPEVSPPARGERGRATFASYTKDGQRTHKAANVGTTPFHNLSFILKHPAPGGFTPSSRTGVRGYTQILDNERVRGWRIILEPGQAAGEIRQQAPGLRIVIDGGILAEIVPGQADRGMSLRAGDFLWQEAGTTRAVRNTGTTRLEFVEFELK